MADRPVLAITLTDADIERIAERVAAKLAGTVAGVSAMTTKQAASFCQCSEAHLDNLRSRGGGPKFVRLGGRGVRYIKDDLVAWLRGNARANTAGNSP